MGVKTGDTDISLQKNVFCGLKMNFAYLKIHAGDRYVLLQIIHAVSHRFFDIQAAGYSKRCLPE